MSNEKYLHRFLMQVCSVCQNDCSGCVTEHARKIFFRDYQLSLKKVEYLIKCTKSSKYKIGELHIAGLGEPTLWKHFNDGVQMFADAKFSNKIILTTNGGFLEKIAPGTYNNLFSVRISLFNQPSHVKQEVARLQKEYGAKIKGIDKMDFEIPIGEEAAIPCVCRCPGVTYIDGRIYPYCGPEVFNAIKNRGRMIEDYPEIYEEMAPNYLEKYWDIQSHRKRNLEICKYCWGNRNFKMQLIHPDPKKNCNENCADG